MAEDKGSAEEAVEAEAALETNAVGVAVALDEARADPTLKDDVQAFLRGQLTLIADQRHHLHEQFKQLRIKRANELFKATLQAMAVATGLAVGVAVAMLAWQAHEAKGLVIEAFSVPPDLAQRGLTGQVVATKLLDRMADMQSATNSVRAPSSFARSWGDDIKVEVPGTGVSLAELNRQLRAWLGHETRVSGEMVRTPEGLALTVRADVEAGATFAGRDTELDAMIQRGAEAVYDRTQPYRYGVWLFSQGRDAEAEAVYRRESGRGSAGERAWAYVGLGNNARFTQGERAGLSLFRTAARLAPTQFLPWSSISLGELLLSHPQAALAASARAAANANARGEVRADQIAALARQVQAGAYDLKGDYVAAALAWGELTDLGYAGTRANPVAGQALAHVSMHDLSAARADLQQPDPTGMNASRQADWALDRILTAAWIEAEAGNWAGVVAQAPQAGAIIAPWPGLKDRRLAQFDPLVAYAKARLGDMAGAQALIGDTPPDCYDCIRMRGKIAALAKDWPTAERWFAEAVRQAPSIPFAYADWGEMLLAKGDVAGAVAKLDLAHKAGPHFADPLELWGEALMAQGDAPGAVRKFAEAAKYAPRWGRLHLKWAQALAKSGDAAGARSKAKTAAGLDLTPTERAELVAQRL